MINGWYLSSTGFKPIGVALTMHDSLFKDRYFAAKDLLKLNNTINTRSTRLNITLYSSYSLTIYECLIRQIYQ